jgi:hypothetical protein
MKPINVELFMGHSVGISDSYYRPTENELSEDYLRATDVLTISQEKHLRQEVEILKVENAEIETLKEQMKSMQVIVATLVRLGNDEIDSIYVGDEGKIYETQMFDPVTKKQYESNSGYKDTGANLKQLIADEEK